MIGCDESGAEREREGRTETEGADKNKTVCDPSVSSSLKTKRDEKKTGGVCKRRLPTGSVQSNHSAAGQRERANKAGRSDLHLALFHSVF